MQYGVPTGGITAASRSTARAGDSVRSVDRAIDLLAILGDSGKPLGLAELSHVSDMPKTTVQRLLAALEHRRLVERKSRGVYQLGPGLVHLARRFLAENSLAESSLPILNDLALISGETASLYIRQGFDRIVIQRVESAHHLRYTIRVGQRLPLHLGASGQVLAAALDGLDLQHFVNSLGEIRTADGASLSREKLLEKLEAVRKRGYAVSRGEREPGATSVAAPVTVPNVGVVASIGVTGPDNRMTDDRIENLAAEVLRAARRLAEAQVGA